MNQNVVIDQFIRIGRVVEKNQMTRVGSHKDMSLVVRRALVQKPTDFIRAANCITARFSAVRRIATRHQTIGEHIFTQVHIRNDFFRRWIDLHNMGVAEQKNRIRIFVKACTMSPLQRVDQSLGF